MAEVKIAYAPLLEALRGAWYDQEDGYFHGESNKPRLPKEGMYRFSEKRQIGGDELTAAEASALAGPERIVLFAGCADFDGRDPDDARAHLLGEEAFIADKELFLVSTCGCREAERKAYAVRHGMRFLRLRK